MYHNMEPGRKEKYNMHLYMANCRGNGQNVLYPIQLEVKGVEDVRTAAARDHMPSKMANSYRNTANFLQCDCVMVDVDNTHSDDPDAWKTLNDILEALPVNMYVVRSRNYMKEKTHTNRKTGEVTRQEPREKWHLYCPLQKPITNAAEYEKLMLEVLGLFPFIDPSAMDNARFFFGVESPHVEYVEGEDTLDSYIESWDVDSLRHEQAVNLDGFAAAIQSGHYKNDKANNVVVDKISGLLGVKNPLTAQAAPATDQAPAPAPASDQAGDAPDWIKYHERDEAVRWVESWARKYGVQLGNRYIIPATQPAHPEAVAICVVCPWGHEHTEDGPENESVIIVDLDGKLNYLCRHRHGGALNWKTYRAKVEEDYNKAHPLDVNNLELDPIEDAQEAAGKPQGAEGEQAPSAADQSQQEPKKDYLETFFEAISGERFKPYTTDISWFDFILQGGPIRKTVLLLLAAPAAGKTTLCQQIAESMALHGKRVVYLNLEMSREQMIAKSISSRVTFKGHPMSATDVMQGYRWNPEQREAVEDALAEYREMIDPNLKYVSGDIKTEINKVQELLTKVGEGARDTGKEAPVIILDYLHLVSVPDARGDVQESIKQVMAMLKNYARNYDTFCIAISATNRDSNKDGRITRDSGRDSSNIEYTADYMLSLNFYQIDQGTVKTRELDKIAILESRAWRQMIVRVLKNRWGRSGRSARVYFDAPGNRFYPEHDEFIPDDVVAFDEFDNELENVGQLVATETGEDGEGLAFTVPEIPKGKQKRAGRRR